MKTSVHLWKYLAEFFSKWKMFQTRVAENISTYVLYLIRFSRISCSLYVEKYGTARQATDDNLRRRMRSACEITKSTDAHSENVIFIAFPPQQWFCKRPSLLCLYLHCLSCSFDSHNRHTCLRKWTVFSLRYELNLHIYKVSQEERTILREGVP
jgi:hypothetical protein